MQVPTIPTVHVQEAARRVNGALIRYGHIIPVICFLACIGVSTVVTVQRQLVFTPFVFNFTIPATTTTVAPSFTSTASPNATTTVAPSFTSTASPNATTTVPPLSTTTIAPSMTTTQAPSTTSSPSSNTTEAPTPNPTPAPSTTTTAVPQRAKQSSD